MFDHNIAEKQIAVRADGRLAKITHGRVGDDNIIDPYIFHTFVDFDPRRGKTDLRPLARSPAVGAGSADQAPAVDVSGRTANARQSISAHSHGKGVAGVREVAAIALKRGIDRLGS